MSIKELKQTSELVKHLLKTKPETRNSDMLLFVEVCRAINPDIVNYPMWYVLLNLKEFGLPNTETVRRARQKIQAQFPNLASDERIRRRKADREEDFRIFARETI